MDNLKSVWDYVVAGFAMANRYGLPIPLILGMGIFYFFLRRGMKWATRESHYIDLLKNLGIWQISLSDRLDYYQEPGSEYNPDPDGEHFLGLGAKGYAALERIKELIPTARIYLSEASLKILDDLINEHWSIKEHGQSSTEEYLELTSEQVQGAYNKLLADAKRDFKRSEYLDIVKALKPASK